MTWLNHVHVGDCRHLMRQMIADGVRVQCIVTSPPYWGLRDYGNGAQIGLERTPARYVARLRSMARLARELLTDDGTLWLNLGDCYATGAGKVGDHPGGGEQGARWRGDIERQRDPKRRERSGHAGKHTYRQGPQTQPNRMPISGLKPKDLCGIPWRVAFALQADGWWLRSDIVWHKPNPMPESVTDRPTKAHEYVFLMAKSERYFYDAAAIKEPAAPETDARYGRAAGGYATPGQRPHNGILAPRKRSGNKARKFGDDRGRPGSALGASIPWEGDSRNKRSVWTVNVSAFTGAHFATFPRALIEPCILAGSRPGDVILDPFMGSGTVAEVALSLGRKFIGCELNPEYAAMFRTHRSQQEGMAL